MKVPNYDAFPSLKIVLASAKSVDPGEMPHSAPCIWVFTVCLSINLGGPTI